ncbi:conserved hypothetical protein [Tenacibaculum maritimum]|uniref:hypothetical protein n=1 Tax=Tenacibaculum maritimum TaxID=107401 RepID=UPI0012E5E3E8|nr:hypothetical protein [Tenacibaculum maritimum]CAA0259900.1 conserved hypothetical protein [Tenacibaculum maritimum]
MNYIEAFKKLQEYSKNLESIEYEKLIDLLKNSIQKIPIPLAKLRPESSIERARANNGTPLFKSIEDLGYIKNKEVIKKLSKFGRANKPHEILFYSAIQTSELDKPRVTAIAETSRLFLDKNSVQMDGELFTISRWRNKQELIIAEVVFAEEAIKNNKDIKASYEKQKQLAKELQGVDSEFFEDFLIFISNEYARVADNHNDYKISTAYTELVLTHKDVQGITYPSVQTNYVGANLVLPTNIVDEFLYPEVATTSILYKNRMKMTIGNGGHFCKKLNDKPLVWEKLDEKYMTPKEDLLKGLSEE